MDLLVQIFLQLVGSAVILITGSLIIDVQVLEPDLSLAECFLQIPALRVNDQRTLQRLGPQC